MRMQPRTRTLLAWLLWLATFGCCAAGLVVTVALIRPLTADMLAEGAVYALVFPFGFAVIGLVLSLRRPANPIGCVRASWLAWSLVVPLDPGPSARGQLHPLPLAAQLAVVVARSSGRRGPRLAHPPPLLVPEGPAAVGRCGWWSPLPWPVRS